MIERPTSGADEGGGVWPDESFSKGHPLIVEYMTQDKWPDGKRRELSSVSIKFQDGMVLGTLSDHATSRSLFRTAVTVLGAFKALEKALGSPDADWRPWRGSKGKK